jgi:hypothetical protein
MYLDEFPTFATLSLSGMLSRLHKHRAPISFSPQCGSQGDEKSETRSGHAGTLISCRAGVLDAEILEKEFFP